MYDRFNISIRKFINYTDDTSIFNKKFRIFIIFMVKTSGMNYDETRDLLSMLRKV